MLFQSIQTSDIQLVERSSLIIFLWSYSFNLRQLYSNVPNIRGTLYCKFNDSFKDVSENLAAFPAKLASFVSSQSLVYIEQAKVAP